MAGTKPTSGVPTLMRVGRAVHGWSQRELALKLGCPLWRVTKLELGIIQPTDRQVAEILDTLDLPGMERSEGDA